MTTEDVVVTTRDGECPAVVVTPEGVGPWPAVIVFMDAGGLRPAIVAIAERIAAMGYVAFAPEMYYRSGPYEPFDMESAFGDDAERARLMGMITAVTKANAASDTAAFLDYLAARPDVSGEQVGTTGYCMGGGLSLNAAARFPDRVAAAASFHGGNLAGDAPDSPHLIAGDIAGRVYVAAASDDRSFPAEQERTPGHSTHRRRRRLHARDLSRPPRLRRDRLPRLRPSRRGASLRRPRIALRLDPRRLTASTFV